MRPWSRGRRDPHGGSLANSCPWASSGQGARRERAAGTRPLAWMDPDRRTMPHAGPSLEANELAHATEASALGLPPPLPPRLVPAAPRLRQSLRPRPPSCDSPWSRRAAGGVI